MAPTMPAMPNADLAQGAVAKEVFFQNARHRDVGNSEKLIDLAFAQVTMGSGVPVALPLDIDDGDPQHIPVDANRLTVRCDASNSNGSTTGTIAISVVGPGGTDTASITILAGDTTLGPKKATVTLSAGNIDADCIISFTLVRNTGAGNVRAEALGLISTTWNSET